MLAAALPLILALICGLAFAGLGLFEDPAAAISALNRFALYLAFPALIFANVASAELAGAGQPGFLLASVAPTLILLGLVALVRRVWTKPEQREARAALGMGAIMGNVAYLGIPLCGAILGPAALGLASLSAAIHMVLGISLGSWSLLRGSGDAAKGGLGSAAKAVAKQPLVWAPLLGLAARALPAAWLTPALEPCRWIGAAASPVALFMIGMYLFVNRRDLARLGLADLALIAAKLLALPALALACVALARSGGWIELEAAKVVVLQASMPIAVTSFALAEDYGVGRDPLLRGIVGSTVAFALLSPLLAWLLG